MNKIESFTVDHIHLNSGIYVSRKDVIGTETITTFDLRMKRPNKEPVINTGELHAIEHLGATFLRNHKEFSKRTVYFGPMGCRTGFYLILAGDLAPESIVDLVTDLFKYIESFEGQIPGESPKDCGNYLDMNLPMAQYEAREYLDRIQPIDSSQMTYPNS